jgi:uncharacterized protein (DUF58 family)
MKKPRMPRIYPTSGLAGLLFVLIAIWYAAATQGNAAVYLFLFVLTAVFFVSIPHTLLNLVGLKATAQSVKPTFAGGEVSLPVEIVNQSTGARHGIEVSLPGCKGRPERINHVSGGKAARVTLRFAALSRGQHQIGALRLESLYPLGFLRALRLVTTRQQYLVYPRPTGDPNLPVECASPGDNTPQPELGEGDDFAGVRTYILGESQRHIDWKAAARGQGLMTKQFSAETRGSLYFDFAAAQFPSIEGRLSQLTLWVIEAERVQRAYGLRLPTGEIAPSLGQAHFHRCLRALALFDEDAS